MIYRTEIYNGYVLGEAREKSAFPFFYEAFFFGLRTLQPWTCQPQTFQPPWGEKTGFNKS